MCPGVHVKQEQSGSGVGCRELGYSFCFFGWQKASRRPEGNVALSFCFSSKTKQTQAECREETVFVDSRVQSRPPMLTNAEIHLRKVDSFKLTDTFSG